MLYMRVNKNASGNTQLALSLELYEPVIEPGTGTRQRQCSSNRMSVATYPCLEKVITLNLSACSWKTNLKNCVCLGVFVCKTSTDVKVPFLRMIVIEYSLTQ